MGSAVIQFIIGALVLGGFFFYFQRRIKKLETGEALSAELRLEIQTLIAELNQTTDRNLLLVEKRIAALKKSLQEADKRLSLMDKTTPVSAPLSREDVPVDSASEMPEKSIKRERVSSALDEKPESEATYAHLRGRRPQAAGSTDPEEEYLQSRPKRDQVLYWHRRGEPSRIVSQKTGLNIGEVELILSLHGGER